ncbi:MULTISPECIES: hypothetical protein [Halolamina]|uniref:Uncharacterized protein n=1 Tax=Halolamina pelagica TaxID=699431 RepID=A0A1I5QUV9_9EURY|nr:MULTISPECIES: hypothetical protein [Halolamina]NHX35553.1 hypothetical protein [Halolamina sp. R1-12]SFP50022.1 hypothetical protein SAMN05216277_10497 [Halolamina pelagica]
MFRSGRLPARIGVALAGATVIVVAELLALSLSVRLTAAGVDGAVPASSLPVVAVSVAATGLAVAVWRRTEGGATFAVSGVALIVAAPITAFGGGCGVRTGNPGVFRSGVRIGIAADGCVTFINGALLVLGYALLSAGLWLVADELSVSGPRRLPGSGRSD